jgi:asparagine synthase (glutamine-hydrolysing)
MSGVFGLAVSNKQEGASTQADCLGNKMAKAMAHRSWFMTDHMIDESQGIVLGRVGIGIFNQLPQPVWNATRTIALVMAGELYNRDELDPQGAHRAEPDEQFALALYEQLEADFARHLNGVFIMAIWDQPRRRLIITNDRFGLYPLFYSYRAGCFIFAPEMKGVLCDETLPRTLDLTALAQYMRFQHLLGTRTFFEEIKLLPNATVLTYDLPNDQLTLKPYWSFADIPHRPDITFNKAVEEAGHLFRRAVQRMTTDAYRPGVFLSGGLDSRTILGFVQRRPVISLTYGQEDCRDVYYAGRVAKVVGSDHHWFDLPNGDWVKEQADFHLDVTEGYHSWIHAHGLSILPQARDLMDVNLTGWDGGTVMGHKDSVEPLQIHSVDDAALTTRLFNLFNQKYTWPSLDEAEEGFLYCEAIGKRIQKRAFESFREEITPFLHYRPDVRGEYFYLRNHVSRLTYNFITFTRSHIEVRFPFFDYDLFNFLYSIPAQIRGHRTLYQALIQREMPRLAYIPYDKDELLPTTHTPLRQFHATGVKLKRRFNRHVWPLFRERPTLYADYENYLRHELRDWAENILYDRRTTEHGIFNPDFVRTLMQRHLSPMEEWTIGKIAAVMTYEMMLRKFYD